MTDEPKIYTGEEWLARFDYKEKLDKYKTMTPEQQMGGGYENIVNEYNKTAVAINAGNDYRAQLWSKALYDYPVPNLEYEYEEGAEPQPVREPVKDWKPPEVKGEKPLTQYLTGASNWLRNQKMGFLADAASALGSVYGALVPTEVQALYVDVLRDIIGWSAEANATWKDPNKGTLEKALNIVTSGLVSPLAATATYGARIVSMEEMHARVIGKGYATEAELKATPRERYEMAKAFAGTTETIVSGMVDIGRAVLRTYGGMTSEKIAAAWEGKWGEVFGVGTLEFISRSYKEVSSELAHSDAQKAFIEAEFLRRHRAGESSDLLALELNDASKELLAQVMYDPLNFLDFVISPIMKGLQVRKYKELNNLPEMLKATGKVDDFAEFSKAQEILRAATKGSDEAIDAAKTIKRITDSMQALSDVEIEAARLGKLRARLPFTQKYEEIGGPVGRVFATFSSAHADDALRGVSSVMDEIVRGMADIPMADRGKYAQDLLWAYGRYGAGIGDNPGTFYDAIAMLTKSDSANFFFSKGGGKTAKYFTELLFDEVGMIDYNKLAKLSSIITDNVGEAGAVVKITQAVSGMVEDVFPSIGRRLEFETRAASMLSDIEVGPSKRILDMQDDIAKAEKKAANLRSSIKGKMTDAEFREAVEGWVKSGDMPKEAKKLNKIMQDIEDTQRTIRQSSELPRNLRYWVDNPVTEIEKLGWKVLEAKESLYNKFMPLLNRVYIRWNPGQWGRNFITNEMHVMLDHGFTAGMRGVDRVESGVKLRVEQGWVHGTFYERASSMTGDVLGGGDLKTITGPLGHKVERLGHGQTVIAAADDCLDGIFSKIARENQILANIRIPDDLQKAFLAEVRATGDAKVALKKILGGEEVSNALMFFDSIEDQKLMQKLGLIDDLNDAATPGKVMKDDIWDAVMKKVEDSSERAKALLPSHSPEDLPDNKLVQSWLDDANDALKEGLEPNPLMVHGNYYYHAQAEQFNETFIKLYGSGKVKLSNSPPEIQQMWEHICLGGGDDAKVGFQAIQRSVGEATQAKYAINNKYLASKGKIPYSQKMAEINKVMYDAAEEQYRIYMATLDAQRGFLAKHGVNVADWESDLQSMLFKAEELYGDTVYVRTWDMDIFMANGRRINYVGENGSPVLNVFVNRGIPTHTDPGSVYAATIDNLGRPYSWKSIQGRLRRYGIDWDIPKLCGKSFTAEELKQLETACDAMADAEKIIPQAGLARKSAWLPTTDWQEVPKGAKYIDPRLQIDIRDGKTFARLDPGSVSETHTKIVNDSILRNTATDDELKRLDELSKEAAKLSEAPLEELPLDRMAREDKVAVADKKLNELRAEIMNRYQRNVKTMTPHDIAAQVGMDQAVMNQFSDVKRIIEDVRGKAQARHLEFKPGRKFTPVQEAAFYQRADEINKVLTDMRPVVKDVVQARLDFTMLNYNDRRGFDNILSCIFPYHFWYSRTYYNWIKRLAQKPELIAAYVLYRKTLERIHADAPTWWKYNLNSNELLGMDSDNPLYFNLEATFNPLNGLTGVDYNDSGRSKGWFANLVQQTGKYGPSVHTPILLAIGLAQALTGHEQEAEAWLGRLIPQTGTLKAVTNLLGFDPQGLGGLEMDPMVLALGGLGKYERRGIQRVISQFEAEGQLPDGTKFTHEQAIEAQYAQSGPIWEMAATVYNQQRAPGRLLTSIGGPGFQSRPQTDMYIDQFYEEINDLWARKGLMDDKAWSRAMGDIYRKHPYASGLLMARKSGVARDEALVYDILNRIPPGQTSEYAKLFDIDPDLIDRFYSMKGLTDDDGKPTMTEIETQRFMAGIRDLGSIMAMPPTAVRNEWNAARRHYGEVFSRFSDEVMRNVDTWYIVRDKDAELGRQYLAQHPEVSEYLSFREQAITQDAILFRYYGGIDFLEKYYKRIMASTAAEKWPEIERIAMAYDQVRSNGGDTKGFLVAHPELREYWNFLDAERGKIKKQLAALSSKIPESPQAFWREDAKNLSAIAKGVYEDRLSMIPDNEKAIDSLALPFIGTGEETTPEFSFNQFLSSEAEKRWPGITKTFEEYKRTAAKNPGLASAFLTQHPEVAEYMKWEKEMRKRYNAALKGQAAATQAPVTWGAWKSVFSSSMQRLIEEYFTTGTLSPSARKNLERTLAAAGIYDVDAWLAQMASSASAGGQ